MNSRLLKHVRYTVHTTIYTLKAQTLVKKQGNNARKVILEMYASLYCSVLSLGEKVNTRRMSQPDMESIFTKITIM